MNEKSGVKPGKVNPLVRCANCRHWEPTGEIFRCFGIDHRLGYCRFDDGPGERESAGDCERCENFDGGTEDV